MWVSVVACIISVGLFTLSLLSTTEQRQRLDEVAAETRTALCAIRIARQKAYHIASEINASEAEKGNPPSRLALNAQRERLELIVAFAHFECPNPNQEEP